MPSFDIVSEVDWQEVKNAVNQANREVSTRFDFKGSNARVEESDPLLTIHADDDFKVGPGGRCAATKTGEALGRGRLSRKRRGQGKPDRQGGSGNQGQAGC